MEKQIYIVIPIFNESLAIAEVITETKKAGYEKIIVVDDGSSDNGADVAREAGALVLRHSINRGKGASVKTGIEMAKLLGADIVVTMDGDGQHNPEDIQLLLCSIGEKYDVALGTRMKCPKGMPLHKRLANHIANILSWIIYGVWVTDSQSGFRAYSKKAIQAINTSTDRYEYDSEVLREIKRNRLEFAEMPIQVRYTAYSLGKKNRQTFVTGLKTAIKIVLS